MNITYVGDGRNNVTYSLMCAAVLTGDHLRISCPDSRSYRPDPSVANEVAELSRTYSGTVQLVPDPAKACDGAHVVYTDSWMSYRVPPAEKEGRLADLAPYRVDGDLISRAHDDVLFMHCLPAMRGEQVTADVIDGIRSVVFDQAENRLHAEKAILVALIGTRDYTALLP